MSESSLIASEGGAIRWWRTHAAAIASVAFALLANDDFVNRAVLESSRMR